MHEHVLKIKNIDGKILYTNSKILVEGILDIYNKYGFSEPGLGYDIYNIEAEAAGQEVIFFKDSSPQTSQKKFLINSIKDYNKLKNIKIVKDGRMNFVVNTLKEFKEATHKTPPLQFCAPFSLAVALYGYERLVIDMYTKPKEVHELMNIITENILIPWIEYQKDIIPDWKIALALPPNLTLDLIEEFVLPYIIKLKNSCGKNVGVVNWWGESYVKDLDRFLDLKLKASPDKKILRVQDPDLEKIDLTKITDFVLKNDMDLTFGIGAKLLNGGKPNQIIERVKKYATEGMKINNFSLYLCNISKDTPEDNIYSVVNAVRELIKN